MTYTLSCLSANSLGIVAAISGQLFASVLLIFISDLVLYFNFFFFFVS